MGGSPRARCEVVPRAGEPPDLLGAHTTRTYSRPAECTIRSIIYRTPMNYGNRARHVHHSTEANENKRQFIHTMLITIFGKFNIKHCQETLHKLINSLPAISERVISLGTMSFI
jgi:hypothetical protein